MGTATATMTDTAPRALISVQDITQRFPHRAGTVTALDDVSLDIAEGSFVSIVGPSGCGKSTLLKMILGLVEPTSGHIFTGGEVVTGPRPEISMMFQSSLLLPWRTVVDNVLLPIDLLGLKRRDFLDRARELLDMVGLADFARYRPDELSGGMQQRAAICRALIHDPRMLLLDEPFGALDHITREQLNDDLLRIWSETGKTVLLVTHDVDEAIYLSDRVVVMTARPGRVAAELAIDLRRPRGFEVRRDPAFDDHAIRIRELLGLSARGSAGDVEPGEAP